MDNFEKKVFLTYYFNIEGFFFYERYSYDELLDELIKEFKNIPDIVPTKGKELSQKKLDAIVRKNNRLLKKYLKEKLTSKKSHSSIEKKCELVAKTYSLSHTEYQIFIYYLVKSLNEAIFSNMLKSTNIDESNSRAVCQNVLNMKSFFVLRSLKSLVQKGLLTKHTYSRFEYEMNSLIYEIFQNPDIKTEKQIMELLLGKHQKSELCWSDFEYLEQERNLTLSILLSAVKNQTKGVNILLYGDVGTGKTQLCKLIANKAGINMYSVKMQINSQEADRCGRLGDLKSKQTILSKLGNSCILFDEAEDVMNRGFTEYGSASKAYLNSILEETPVPVFWTTNNIYDVDPAFLRRMTYSIEFERLTDDIRLNIWKRVIKKNKFKVDNTKLVELNKTYDIPPSLITNAVKATRLIDGNQEDFEIFVENVARVVTKKKNVKKKKEFEMTEYNDNLVNTDIDIKDLTSKIKSCGRLNFSLCLYGEPGTGKSLYARYLAKELGIEVILKRASDLMSMYVGETEHNIAEAFAEAKVKRAMLIIDEADSFLHTRNSAQRRWEVSQVNEMLTWMEAHEYPFVCTTNLLDTLDEASLRRFTFKIKFDFMKKEQVENAFEHFFGIKNADVNIKGLTAGDFSTVKKKADFLGITSAAELSKMLEDEVKIKKSTSLKNVVGF